MFVFQSKYDKLARSHSVLQDSVLIYERKIIRERDNFQNRLQCDQVRYDKLVREYRQLEERFNWNLSLNESNDKKSKDTFTPKEIKTLIALCHPDKHDNKRSATDITAKLLEMNR